MGKILTSPLTSLVLLVLGAQFFQVYVTIALSASGFGEFAIGWTHSASYAGLLFSALYSEKLIHRIGHIRAFSTFSSIITATILIQAFTINLWLWIIARFCSGLSLAALYVTIESWLLAESTISDRGKRLAIYMITLYFSQAVSSQLLNIVDTRSIQPYLLAAVLCSIASIPVSLTHHSTPILPVRKPLRISEVYNLNPYAFLGCFISGLTLSALYSFTPKYANEFNISISWIMSTLICGGFILQWPLGKLSDIFNREKVLICLSISSLLPTGILIYASSKIIIFSMIFLTGGITFALYPISISLACDRLEHRCIVQTTGVLLFSYGLGSVIGPLLVALGIDILNASWFLFAFVASVVGFYGLYGMIKWITFTLPDAPSSEESVECVLLPKVSPIANELDPRQEVVDDSVVSMPEAANQEEI